MQRYHKRLLLVLFVAGFILVFQHAYAVIIDHRHTDITQIPEWAINQAKSNLHIAYGHTSHGSQLTTGMSGLVAFANGGGKGLSLPANIFAWNEGGTGGALDLDDYFQPGDLGNPDRSTWATRTRTYLDNPANSDVNVIIWSWCGQVNGTEADINLYLSLMNQLELDYPDVDFIYMTGHSNGTGETGNVHLRNQQIRNYCITNNKHLYDFYDIECYNPDGDYFGDKLVNDNCDYDSDGNGSLDRNWAIDWQNSHTENVDWYNCSAAHSQALNGNQKAYTAWWLWAYLGGWDMPLSVQMLHYSATAEYGKGVSIHWQTASEVDCIGFHIWRAEIGTNDFRCLTHSVIPGQGNVSGGCEYEYVDTDVSLNTDYMYKIEVLFADGRNEIFGPIQPIQVEVANILPDRFSLYPNYPNPFNLGTCIGYDIPESGSVQVAIFDASGRQVRTLFQGEQPAGFHKIYWDGRDASGCTVSSGIYISRFVTPSLMLQQKMMLVK